MQYAHTWAGARAVPRIQKVFGLNTSDKSPHCTHTPAREKLLHGCYGTSTINLSASWLARHSRSTGKTRQQAAALVEKLPVHSTQPNPAHTPDTHAHTAMHHPHTLPVKLQSSCIAVSRRPCKLHQSQPASRKECLQHAHSIQQHHMSAWGCLPKLASTASKQAAAPFNAQAPPGCHAHAHRYRIKKMLWKCARGLQAATYIDDGRNARQHAADCARQRAHDTPHNCAPITPAPTGAPPAAAPQPPAAAAAAAAALAAAAACRVRQAAAASAAGAQPPALHCARACGPPSP